VNVMDADVSKDIIRQPELDAYLVLLVSGMISDRGSFNG